MITSVGSLVDSVERTNNGYLYIGSLPAKYESVIKKAVVRGLLIDTKRPNAWGDLERVLMLPKS